MHGDDPVRTRRRPDLKPVDAWGQQSWGGSQELGRGHSPRPHQELGRGHSPPPPERLRPLTSVLCICASACVTLRVFVCVASRPLVHYVYTCVCVCVCGSVCVCA